MNSRIDCFGKAISDSQCCLHCGAGSSKISPRIATNTIHHELDAVDPVVVRGIHHERLPQRCRENRVPSGKQHLEPGGRVADQPDLKRFGTQLGRLAVQPHLDLGEVLFGDDRSESQRAGIDDGHEDLLGGRRTDELHQRLDAAGVIAEAQPRRRDREHRVVGREAQVGSQGERQLNDVLVELAPELVRLPLRIVHQTGEADREQAAGEAGNLVDETVEARARVAAQGDFGDRLGGVGVDAAERQAEEIFAHIKSLGDGSMLEGAIKGIEENWFQGRITDSAFELERKVNEGRRIIVGVNAFTEGNDEEQIPLLRITNEDEQRQRKRLDAVRDRRDTSKVDAVLARLRSEAADSEINLMPTLIEAAQAYATLGEIMSAMGSVFGRHVEVPTF